jgi:class 3 adenylate cyclase
LGAGDISAIRCLNCHFENPPDARFCQNCGRPLGRACPNCGTLNEPGTRFCKQCGTRLASEAGTEEPASASIAPVRRKEAALRQGGERRLVTVLFADVVGSTALAEEMDPEEWTTLMNQAFMLLTPVIERYEGTLARLMGDGLLALFGAPVAHEDDPVRAVYAALDLLEAAGQFARQAQQAYGIQFAIRVGVNTGNVFVGEVGSDLAYEYTAMGDDVNLAARLQSAARPMSVWVSEATRRLAAPEFDFLDIGEVTFKGKSRPVRVYEVSGVRSSPGKPRGLSGMASPLIGRQAELDRLLALIPALAAGVGRAVLVTGEAGLGKTRLIQEWQLAAAQLPEGERVQWITGHSQSIGTQTPYHLVRDLVQSLLGLPHLSTDEELSAALGNLLSELFGEQSRDLWPYLGHMLALRLEVADQGRISLEDPQLLQRQYGMAFQKLLLACSARRPLVLLLEDLHWADPSSVEMLVRLLPLAFEAPLLFCCITRPERISAGWKLASAMQEVFGAGLVEITLRQLDPLESSQVVANLLDSLELPAQITGLILKKAEGNPFYIEELIRTLVDNGVIARQAEGWAVQREVTALDIPETLQGLLLARIDRLPEEARRLLRVAAVIGRQFSLPLLEDVLGKQAEP